MVNADSSYQAERPSQVFSRRVREVRKRRDWTQAQLAERLTEIGHPTTQATIARIESPSSTRARNVSLDEAFAVAAALGVAPLYLLLPLTRDERVAIGNIVVNAGHARKWLTGTVQLLNEDDLYFYLTERDPALLRDFLAESAPDLADEVHLEAERLRADSRRRRADAEVGFDEDKEEL